MANTGKYAGSETEKNLYAAFAGETQARSKYTYFASVAKKQGFDETFDDFAAAQLAKKDGVKLINDIDGIYKDFYVDTEKNRKVISDYMNAHPDANLKVVALTDEASQVAIPVRKEARSAALLAAINQAISELDEEGELSRISEKYFGKDISKAAAE